MGLVGLSAVVLTDLSASGHYDFAPVVVAVVAAADNLGVVGL